MSVFDPPALPLSNQPYVLEGSRYRDQACLCLHGLGGGIYELQWLAHHLHQAGLTIQAFLYPGHDQPTPLMPASTWSEWYHCALDHYEKLCQRYSRITLIGFSTGCPLALHLAAQVPVDRIVLLSPFLAIRHHWYWLLKPEDYLHSIGYALDWVPRLRLAVNDPIARAAAEQASHLRTFNLPAVRSALELIEQVKQELPQIQAPTLILQSPQDSVVDPLGAELIYRTLGSQQKHLHWLKESDHLIGLDIERDQVFAKVRSFLISA